MNAIEGFFTFVGLISFGYWLVHSVRDFYAGMREGARSPSADARTLRELATDVLLHKSEKDAIQLAQGVLRGDHSEACIRPTRGE